MSSTTVAPTTPSTIPPATASSDPIPTPTSSSSLIPASSSFPIPATQLSPIPTTQPSPSPIPTTQFYHDPILFARIANLESSVEQLSGRVKKFDLELQNMKRKNNQRDGRPSKQRKLNVEARVLTSAEGKRLAAQKDAERAAKEQKDAATRRKQKENDREQQRRDRAPDAPFMGSLSSKNKPDLQEIAGALSVAEEGTKEVLIRRINAFFDTNPHIRDSERFVGLSNRAHRRRIDMNGPTQIQICDNSSHIPSASQGIFTPVQPNHSQFNFYHPRM